MASTEKAKNTKLAIFVVSLKIKIIFFAFEFLTFLYEKASWNFLY